MSEKSRVYSVCRCPAELNFLKGPLCETTVNSVTYINHDVTNHYYFTCTQHTLIRCRTLYPLGVILIIHFFSTVTVQILVSFSSVKSAL